MVATDIPHCHAQNERMATHMLLSMADSKKHDDKKIADKYEADSKAFEIVSAFLKQKA